MIQEVRIVTTRRGLRVALDRQGGNGFGVYLAEWVVFRPFPNLWTAQRKNTNGLLDEHYFTTATAVLDWFFRT